MIQGTTRRGTANRTTRTIRIGKYFEVGPVHIWRQGHFGSSGSRVLGFWGFLGVARKLVKVSEIVEMPREIAREVLGSLGKCLGASGRVRNISEFSQQCFESVTGRNSISPSRTSPRGPKV